MSPSENVPPSEFNSPLLPTLGPHCRTSGSGRDGRSNRRNWEADPAVQGNVNLTLQSTSSPSLAWTGTALRWTTMVTSFTTRTCAPWWVDQPPFFHSSSGLLLLVSLSMSTTMFTVQGWSSAICLWHKTVSCNISPALCALPVLYKMSSLIIL